MDFAVKFLMTARAAIHHVFTRGHVRLNLRSPTARTRRGKALSDNTILVNRILRGWG